MVDYKALPEQPNIYEDEMVAVHEGYRSLGSGNVYNHFYMQLIHMVLLIFIYMVIKKGIPISIINGITNI